MPSICQQIWKTQLWPQDWKGSVFIPIPKKSNAKECWNYHTVVLISCASKLMLKILQARLQQYVNWECPDVPAGFRKGRGTRDQIANIHWIIEKAKKLKKKKKSASLTTPKPLTMWITTNCGKFLKRWEYQTAWPVSWEACMHDKKWQLEPELRVWIWGTVYSRGPSGSPRAVYAVSGNCPFPFTYRCTAWCSPFY